MSKYLDLQNKRFGKLTVIDRAKVIIKRTKWNVICDCGKLLVTRGDQFMGVKCMGFCSVNFLQKNYDKF